MKVKDLIYKLECLDPEALVVIPRDADSNIPDFSPINIVANGIYVKSDDYPYCGTVYETIKQAKEETGNSLCEYERCVSLEISV